MGIYAKPLGDAISSAAHWPRQLWPPPGRSRPAPPRARAPAPDELGPRRSGERHQPVRSEVGSTVDAVIFNGGYGIDYAEFAGKQVEAKQSGVTVKVLPSPRSPRPCSPASLRATRRTSSTTAAPGDRDQYHPRSAGRAERRHRGQELRGHGHQGHAVPGRHRARNVRRQVHCAELRPHRVRDLVLGLTLRGERLDRSEDV